MAWELSLRSYAGSILATAAHGASAILGGICTQGLIAPMPCRIAPHSFQPRIFMVEPGKKPSERLAKLTWP
jgi:hypothetical protein